MNDTMKISKNEYRKLRQQATAYRKLIGQIFESVLTDSIEAVVKDFRKTNIYSEAFLKDLKDGLQKSSYAKR